MKDENMAPGSMLRTFSSLSELLTRRVQALTGTDPIATGDDLRRRLFAFVFVSLLIPIQIYFTFDTAMEGEVVHAWFNGTFAAVLITFALLLLQVRRPRALYYTLLLITSALFVYLVSDSEEGAGRLFWLFVFAPVATIGTGRWAGSILAAALLLTVYLVRSELVPGGLSVNALDFFRFSVAYLILGVLTHVAEYAWEQTHKSLIREHSALLVASNEIRRLSITDPLTGVYNRQFLADRLPAEVERARRYDQHLSVLMCDLDHFKALNDTFGHPAGDALLRTFCATVKRSIRKEIDWVARYGGEEFLIVLPETGLEQSLVVGERLRRHVEELEVPWADTPLRCTASFGAAELTDSDWSSDKLIRAADRSLYRAKKQGRNRVVAGLLGAQ